jgi:hypothetical protein
MQTASAADAVRTAPTDPAVYVLYGGVGRGRHVAYVGISGTLRQRLRQHLVRRDSSIATNTSAASLNPDRVTRIEWWALEAFADRATREAAEQVALDVFEPVLCSRGSVSPEAEERLAEDEFQKRMETVFEGEPSGAVDIPTLTQALAEITALRERVAELEATVEAIRGE